jgi:O-antigen/teichoic acid export membrane protein
LALALYLVPAPLFAIGMGRLQGLQAFVTFAVISVAMAIARLVLTFGALEAGGGVTAVVVVTVVVTAAGAAWALAASRRAAPMTTSVLWRDAGRAAAALALFWLMVSVDVPIARHYLEAEAAGQYTAASVIGKAVLWLPGAISLVMFPRVAQVREEGGLTHPLLVQSLVLTITVCAAAVVGLRLVGGTIIPLFFGASYEAGAGVAWKVGLVCLPFAAANLLLFYHLTRPTSRFLVALIVGAVLEIVALTFLNDTFDQIVIALGLASAAVVAGLVLPGTWRRARDRFGWAM